MKKKLDVDFNFNQLSLPSRFEVLEREITELGLDINQIVYSVDTASNEIEGLLKSVNFGSIGKFRIFLGTSGSGKTTFLKTLSNFFSEIDIITIDREISLAEIPEFIINEKTENNSIFVIEDRDNPNESTEDLRVFFEELRFLFRKPEGEVLVIWPITDKDSAETIGKIAWDVGRDSITPPDGAIYSFKGLDKKEFYNVANITSKNINGSNLESYGISSESTKQILKKVETIGEYFSELEKHSIELNCETEIFLKDKLIPKVWVLLPGDEATEIDRTVKFLTQGIKNRIDIERFIATLDDSTNKSTYLNDWRARRDNAAYLMRLLDVRLFPVYPSLSLAAIRAFGEDLTKTSLKKKTETKEKAVEIIKKTSFFKLLFDDYSSAETSPTATTLTQSTEYLRLQKNSDSNDKLLNRALGDVLIDALDDDNVKAEVYIEQQKLDGLNLQPDILIKIDSRNVICLEPTWRSTGREIKDELKKKQNSLTIGHIQQYVLNKAMEYVKDLGY